MPHRASSFRKRPGLPVFALAAGTLLAGCGDSSGTTEPGPGDECSARPAVGAVCSRAAAEAATIRVEGGGEGAEYVYIPFFASRTGSGRLAVEVEAPGAQAPSGPPSPNRIAADEHGAHAADRFHMALRERERALLAPWVAAGGDAARSALRARRQVTPTPVPTVGQQLTLNTAASCNQQDRRTGRVAAVSQRAIILLDVANPAGGFTDADAAAFAERFDNFVYPVDVRNFGEPTDIDANGRSIVFFTRAVNELTEPGSDSFVGGFFWGGDLLPTTTQAGNRLPGCAGSNFAEVFYMLAPDPGGAVNGNAFSLSFVRDRTVGVLGHEFQHLINASRRLYVNNASAFEEVWLNEALSHVAEELLFYEATGLGPRSNLDFATVAAAGSVRQNFISFGLSNIGRYSSYVESPTGESALGEDNLATRGAAWAFLRYAADHEPGADDAFFRRLVNSTTSGMDNLQAAIGADALDVLQRWTVSVYTDDAVPGVDPLYTQPSWNFRSILPQLTANENRFPLEVGTLTARRTFSLLGGGAAYVRFGVPANDDVSVRTTSGGATPPANLRVSVVRIR